ncbi:HEAT repeat domain-containing protein [Quadrisphaera sp. DSM 44207]|uniref:HEAT repeat domain-containing protein n=1 Tax=Quadrisphaera sp. DSM 44207 TaxID=1881057 RepID=UPI00088B394B|nr:HEAT repeat domain-containing protein [Quadrisphaera sp. DSM 44207]SDQ40463.1 HEAT repeat-containing protein [Quadrisphaera sp. DSM 44207]
MPGPDPALPRPVPAPAPPQDPPAALEGLLAAREGTGSGFPAALSAHARARGADGALADARAWAASPDPAARLVALELLGVLTAPWSPPAPAPVRAELLAEAQRAAGSGEADLRWVAAKVLPSAGAGALPALLRLAADREPDVRWQVVSSLPLLADGPGAAGGEVLRALLAAAEDPDAEVRDQAVFGLAVQLEADTPAVRGALLRALQDAQRPDTAAQAARGLAARGEPRVLPALLQHLGAEDPADVDEGWVEAAAALADPRLLPALRRLREHDWADDETLAALLDGAVAACERGRRDA